MVNEKSPLCPNVGNKMALVIMSQNQGAATRFEGGSSPPLSFISSTKPPGFKEANGECSFVSEKEKGEPFSLQQK